jgi:hypothetical protein
MTAVLITAMLITGPTVDNTWTVADAGSFGLIDASTPPAKRIDRDRVAEEQRVATEQETERVPYGVWDRLAQCESGGDWHINTGNGYYGGLQFTLTSWRNVGGSGYPHQHTREEQILRGERLKAIQGWGAWPACSRKLGLR